MIVRSDMVKNYLKNQRPAKIIKQNCLPKLSDCSLLSKFYVF